MGIFSYIATREQVPWYLSFEWKQYEPCHEIMALFVLRILSLQTRMRSHPMGLDVWLLVGPFVYFHTSCVRTAKALARLRECAGSPGPSLVAYVINTIISWAGSILMKLSRTMYCTYKNIHHLTSHLSITSAFGQHAHRLSAPSPLAMGIWL